MDDKYYQIFDVEMSRVEQMIVDVFAQSDIEYTAYQYPWLSEGHEAMVVFDVPEGANIRQGRFSFFLNYKTISDQGFYAVPLFFHGPKLDGTDDRIHDLELVSCGRDVEAMLRRGSDPEYQGLHSPRK
jgi:hypothetical protein